MTATSPHSGDFPVVGVVGGGQLARMMQPAAVALGIRLRLLADSVQDSAAQVIPETVVGDYRNLDDLRRFARGCDVVTFDHEHVPTEHLRALASDGLAVRPGPDALVYAQDKGLMRRRLADMGVPLPRWAPATSVADVEAFAAKAGGYPVVLKATRGGYDGKGVWLIGDSQEAAEVLSHTQVPGFLVEELVRYTRELSAMVARSPSGQAVAYPVVETVQRDGICHEVYSPAPGLSDEHAVAAQEVALRVAGELGVVGAMAVELFDTEGGVLVNELAMRPHNSGHWSIEGATTSQFENHLRAVLDLPLGDPSAVATTAVMVNVLGGEQEDLYPAYLHCMARDPALKIHVYGKAVKPGRKVGHVTVLGTDLDDLLERARHAVAYMRGDIDE
ncbi:MAG TPA: 5-(carboxyamino)imidazole ribonucleotide synthase [Actinomycetes bacterium]|nr:5-(carboxyamino)imidazole ribonucleotide synthase [Actinomycetes bacterium]